MLTYHLDRTAKKSLYEQLYRGIRADIESGELAADERLPSKRALARHLGVSVITVEGAFDQLVAEGYVRAVSRSGFYVQPGGVKSARSSRIDTSAVLEDASFGACLPELGEFGDENSQHEGREVSIRESLAPRVAKSRREANGERTSCADGARANCAGERMADCSPSPLLADFSGATPPEGVFPYAAWARTMRAVLGSESERTVLAAGEAAGSRQLREAIAAHVRGFRGMEVHPDCIVVGSGAQSLYGLLVQLLGRDRVYGIEDPGYPRLARIYQSNNVALAAVPLDEAGPVPAYLEKAGVDVLHCMPSHQFPLGMTTPVGRRRELLAWAARTGSSGRPRYIIEDDYDCEFRMTGRPVPALQELDGQQCVIYANTFTKTLGAAFRIGYVVLPPHLARQFREKLGFYACTVGALEQLTLARFIASGDYERHVNRQRAQFRRLQTGLVNALEATEAAPRLRFRNVGAGLHFLMEVEGASRPEAFEQVVCAQAEAAGVRLAPLSAYQLGSLIKSGEAQAVAGGRPGGSAAAGEGVCGARVAGPRAAASRTDRCGRQRGNRQAAFVMSYASLQEDLIEKVADVISRAILGAIRMTE